MSVVSEVLKHTITEKTLEKGGLFMALMAVLYIGYTIYDTSTSKERDLILSNLASISQQQLSIQEAVKDINENLFESRVKNDLVLSKVSAIEQVTNKFIYFNKERNTLVIKTPDGELVSVQTKEEKE